MATVPITLHVGAWADKAYESVPAEVGDKIDVMLGLRLKELLVPTGRAFRQAMDRIGREAEERGPTPDVLEPILHDNA